jgi:NTP pyrophosphatase (non-canonical NTP hydrolase)
MGLTFNVLRQANLNRLPTFKNAKGEAAHTKADGSDWTPAQWLQAVTGELGEYANLRKKFERGDIDENTFKDLAGKELADIQTYLDILAFRLGIDLGLVTMSKFNQKSREVNSPILIAGSGACVLKETHPNTWCGELLFVDASGSATDIAILAEDRANRNYELRCKLMDEEKKYKALYEELSRLQNDRAERNLKIEELERRAEQSAEIAKNLNAQLYNATMDIDVLKREGTDLKTSIKNYIGAYETLAQDHISTRNNNYRLVNENENLNNRIKDLLDTVTRTTQENNELKDKLKAIANISHEPEKIELKFNAPDGLTADVRRTDNCWGREAGSAGFHDM